jgi:hypothetical protein
MTEGLRIDSIMRRCIPVCQVGDLDRLPPQAARITASKRSVPRSTKLFFIDMCDILLSMLLIREGFSIFDGRHHLLKTI